MDIVVENILSNAVSFSPDGGRIEVRLRAGAAEIELSVMDDGPGVQPADLPHIFDRYYSNRPAGQPVRGGEAMHHSGVGLWIVSRNVIAAGGRVSAANRPGHGLRVAILLPRDCGAALRS
jgi:two-component system sensor histidine kinase ChvG